MPNVYYTPEKFGLDVFAVLDVGDVCGFDTTVVWEDSNGKLFYASDYGCSCPTPFEGFGKDNLIPIETQDEFDEFVGLLEKLGWYGYDQTYEDEYLPAKKRIAYDVAVHLGVSHVW